MKKFNLYYSASADYEFGHAIYMGENGEEIKTTDVVDLGKSAFSKWKDTVFVGVGVKFLRSIDKCPFGPMPDDETCTEEEILEYMKKIKQYIKNRRYLCN